jgi:hypothetical protein
MTAFESAMLDKKRPKKLTGEILYKLILETFKHHSDPPYIENEESLHGDYNDVMLDGFFHLDVIARAINTYVEQ